MLWGRTLLAVTVVCLSLCLCLSALQWDYAEKVFLKCTFTTWFMTDTSDRNGESGERERGWGGGKEKMARQKLIRKQRANHMWKWKEGKAEKSQKAEKLKLKSETDSPKKTLECEKKRYTDTHIHTQADKHIWVKVENIKVRRGKYAPLLACKHSPDKLWNGNETPTQIVQATRRHRRKQTTS